MTMRTEADPTVWQGRVDAEEGGLGQRWHQTVRSLDAASPLTGAVALAGFACDAGVARNHGRVGAQAGPAAIRRMLANLPARPRDRRRRRRGLPGRCAGGRAGGAVRCAARSARPGRVPDRAGRRPRNRLGVVRRIGAASGGPCRAGAAHRHPEPRRAFRSARGRARQLRHAVPPDRRRLRAARLAVPLRVPGHQRLRQHRGIVRACEAARRALAARRRDRISCTCHGCCRPSTPSSPKSIMSI